MMMLYLTYFLLSKYIDNKTTIIFSKDIAKQYNYLNVLH